MSAPKPCFLYGSIDRERRADELQAAIEAAEAAEADEEGEDAGEER